jgi:hypothetical protein
VVCKTHTRVICEVCPFLSSDANARLQSLAGVRPDAKVRRLVFEDIAFKTDQMLINATKYCD